MQQKPPKCECNQYLAELGKRIFTYKLDSEKLATEFRKRFVNKGGKVKCKTCGRTLPGLKGFT